MLLSKLVYLSVKNAIYYDDSSFIYESYLQGKFDGDPDYSVNIHNALLKINEAISRLNDLERIPYRVDEVTLSDYAFSIANFEEKIERNVKEIVAIAYVDYFGKITPLQWKQIGEKVVVRGMLCSSAKVKVEYKEDIFFDDSDCKYVYAPNETGGLDLLEHTDKELRSYGVSNEMCNKIIEYVKGNLNEPVAAELGNMHVTRAESYFADINPVRSAFHQEVVTNTYRIE